jgi:hypothetical protein
MHDSEERYDHSRNPELKDLPQEVADEIQGIRCELNDKLCTLQDAQEKLGEAIELIEEAVGDNPSHQAYLIEHLKIYHRSDHGFLTGDPNLDSVMEGLQEDAKERIEMLKEQAQCDK